MLRTYVMYLDIGRDAVDDYDDRKTCDEDKLL